MKPIYIIFFMSIILCYPAFAQLQAPNQMQLAENHIFEAPILSLNEPIAAGPALILNEPAVGEPIFSLDEWSLDDAAYASDIAAFGEHDDDPVWFNDAMAGESISTLDKSKFGDVAYASDITTFEEHRDDPAWFNDALNQPLAIRPIGDAISSNKTDLVAEPYIIEGESFWASPTTALTASAAGSPTSKTEELLQKGNEFYDKGLYASALKYYEMAIDTNPNLAELWFNKGNTLYKLGRFEEAVSAYDKAIILNRKFSKAWKNKGFALGALGKTIEAEAAFDNAKELESS